MRTIRNKFSNKRFISIDLYLIFTIRIIGLKNLEKLTESLSRKGIPVSTTNTVNTRVNGLLFICLPSVPCDFARGYVVT